MAVMTSLNQVIAKCSKRPRKKKKNLASLEKRTFEDQEKDKEEAEEFLEDMAEANELEAKEAEGGHLKGGKKKKMVYESNMTQEETFLKKI